MSRCTFFGSLSARSWFFLFLAIVGLLQGPNVVLAQTELPTASLLWKFTLYDSNPKNWFLFDKPHGTSSTSTPAIGTDGTVYLGSFNGTFFAINHAGQEKWRFKTGLEIHSSPAVADDGTIYFGSRDRMFYALNPDGSLKWKFATGAWVDSSPAIAANGTIYFGSWDHNFYALKPDGSLKWKFDAGDIVESSPAIATDGTIYFGSHDHNLYALKPDGTVRWKYSTGGKIISSPAIGDAGVIYFSSLDGNLYALNPDGSLNWKYHTGSITRSSPVVGPDGNLAIGNTNRTEIVSCKGKYLWHRGSPVPVQVSAGAVSGQFYVSAPWRTLLSVETPDHALWHADIAGNASSSLTIDNQGTVYVCAGSSLYAFRPPNEIPMPALGPWPMFRANAQHTGKVGNDKQLRLKVTKQN